tara:strand:- start:2215 stop:3465 length:1251 start_codon:yes stop_codon:yes gene_type:complete
MAIDLRNGHTYKLSSVNSATSSIISSTDNIYGIVSRGAASIEGVTTLGSTLELGGNSIAGVNSLTFSGTGNINGAYTIYCDFIVSDDGNNSTILQMGTDNITLNSPTITMGGNIEMPNDGEINLHNGAIREMRELQMEDWDDNTNTNDTTRLLRRDGNWNFFNGGVALGSFANDYDEDGSDQTNPKDIGTGDLCVKGRIAFPQKSNADGACIDIAINDESTVYGFHWFDDDGHNDQRAWIGYRADGSWHSAINNYDNDVIIQMFYENVSGTKFWPSFFVNTYGGIKSTQAHTTSDNRLKDNIQTITGSLDIIKQLRGVSYTWNEAAHAPTGETDFGLIAQEVELVLPELVSTSKHTVANSAERIGPDGEVEKITPAVDNQKSLNYEHFAGHFVEAIKEQQVIIEELKARIIALEEK